MDNSTNEKSLQTQPSVSDAQDLYSASYIPNCVLNGLLSFTAITLNITAIQAIRKASLLPYPLKILLLSLAVSDLGVGLLVQPFYIAILTKWFHPEHADKNLVSYTRAFTFITTLFSEASFFGVAALSVDRFLAIHLHLRYQELVTHKRVVAVVISMWLLSALLSLINVWTTRNISYAFFVCFGFVCIVTGTLLYYKIFLAVKRHLNQIQALQTQQAAQNGEMENSIASIRKSAASTFYIYLVFLVCYLPETCSLAVIMISGQSTAIKGFSLYAWTLMFLNSSLNPLVYCWKMRHIRHAAMNILRNLLPCNN